MPTLAAKTLGCKVNAYDTEAMVELLEKDGYTLVPFSQGADVYLINTCTVTGTGDGKSLKLIRRVHREHPEAAIIAAGCLAQRDPQLVRLPGVKLVIGAQRRGEVAGLLKQALMSDETLDATAPLKNAPFEQLNVVRHEGKTRAVMKIQEGCNRYCSYCIIPFVRGPVRSMPLCAVEKEAKRLAEAGYREIVLTGIHLMSYGLDTGESLLDAIRLTAGAVPRVRLGSLEPKGISDEFARALSQIPGVCAQFHLSLQSGSAAVLKRMNRRYSAGDYLAACQTLRQYFPGCAVTTDIIVGFPGETEEEFHETLDFAREARLARLHVFPYSRRSGTVADRLPGQVSEQLKKQRAERLIALGEELETAFCRESVGQIRPVLFETQSEDGLTEGYTDTYVRVRARAEAGSVQSVCIARAEGNFCFGEIVNRA